MIKRLARHYHFMREHLWTNSHLSPYLDQEVSAAERIRVEEHTHVCPKCHRMLETLRETLEGLRAMGAEGGAPSGLTDSVMERVRGER
ncbi:MAG: zf-HC2 domain-containing protein [Actinobacteria bacterium]|nr:zf-HC2 domain-containing protein [Actinomycetota bacterium]